MGNRLAIALFVVLGGSLAWGQDLPEPLADVQEMVERPRKPD